MIKDRKYSISDRLFEILVEKTPKERIEFELDNWGTRIPFSLREAGISIYRLHFALCQVYTEEQKKLALFAK